MRKRPSLLERLDKGIVLGAEGYIFELERRGYVQAGAYVPEVVIDYPNAVEDLHREFLRAGAEVMVALTYYADRAKLQTIGRGDELEDMNRQAIQLARKVANEGNALVAGNINNTGVVIQTFCGDRTVTGGQLTLTAGCVIEGYIETSAGTIYVERGGADQNGFIDVSIAVPSVSKPPVRTEAPPGSSARRARAYGLSNPTDKPTW